MIPLKSASVVRWAALAFIALLAFAGAAQAEPKFPELTGRVVDDAHILPAQTQAELTQKLAALEASNGDQLVVVTVPDLQGYDIQDFGYQLGRHWGIGQKGKDNGVVFVIAPNQRKASIEVGYKLEPVLTDTESFLILNRDVFPHFKAGDYPGGVTAGVDSIIRQISSPQDAAAQTAQQAPFVVHRTYRRVNPFSGVIVIVVVVFVLSGLFRRGRGGGILPWIILGAMSGRGRDDDWGGGGGFGGGGGGGGFSGGGGSFGGGGASGGW